MVKTYLYKLIQALWLHSYSKLVSSIKPACINKDTKYSQPHTRINIKKCFIGCCVNQGAKGPQHKTSTENHKTHIKYDETYPPIKLNEIIDLRICHRGVCKK